MMTTNKITAPKLAAPSVFALLSSLGALARYHAPRDAWTRSVKAEAKEHLSVHLNGLRARTPRRALELASGSVKPGQAPTRRDEVDDLLDALAVLSRADATPAARSSALDKLTAYFNGLIGDAPTKFETASMSALKAKINSLSGRLDRAEATSAARVAPRASIAPLKARAARPVVAPAELAAIGAIERATRNTLGATPRTTGGTKPKPLTASQRAAIIAAGFDK